jgi:hypothetical protein
MSLGGNKEKVTDGMVEVAGVGKEAAATEVTGGNVEEIAADVCAVAEDIARSVFRFGTM